MTYLTLLRDLFHQPVFICFLATLACGSFYYLKNEKGKPKKIIWIAYSLIFFLALFAFIGSAIYRIYHPQIWDFTSIYISGKVAASGYNFYQPENYSIVFNSLHLPFTDYQGLVEEVVNTGFHFPPPSMLYFFPLGFLSFKTALIFWTIFNLFFALGCIYLIYSLFFKPYKLNGLLLVSILFFVLLPTLETVNFSQTNFILLFYLLLMKKYQDKRTSGIFLSLALFTKPYMLIFILFFLLRRKWGAILYFTITCIAIVGVTLVLFGKEPFISYIFDNSISRLPLNVYSESINQSLHAILLRSNLITLSNPMTYIYIVAMIFSVAIFYLFYLLKNQLYDYLFPVLLLIALVVYPGTLSHYGVLLLFITFQFFDEKKQLGFVPYLSIPIIGVFYFLSTFSIFTTICFLFLIIILKSLNIFQRNKLIAIKDS